MYMDQKETTVLLSLTVNRKALPLSSRSEALESLTWPAHVKSTHSLRTSHVTWNPFSSCSDISYQRLRAIFSNEYSGSSSEPARVHAHSYRQQARRRWPGLHQASWTGELKCQRMAWVTQWRSSFYFSSPVIWKCENDSGPGCRKVGRCGSAPFDTTALSADAGKGALQPPSLLLLLAESCRLIHQPQRTVPRWSTSVFYMCSPACTTQVWMQHISSTQIPSESLLQNNPFTLWGHYFYN